jgi:hypothetical protein
MGGVPSQSGEPNFLEWAVRRAQRAVPNMFHNIIAFII